MRGSTTDLLADQTVIDVGIYYSIVLVMIEQADLQ